MESVRMNLYECPDCEVKYYVEEKITPLSCQSCKSVYGRVTPIMLSQVIVNIPD